MKFEATYRFVKETKGTLVFETLDLTAVKSIYVQKAALGAKRPKEVRLTLEVPE